MDFTTAIPELRRLLEFQFGSVRQPKVLRKLHKLHNIFHILSLYYTEHFQNDLHSMKINKLQTKISFCF